MEGRWDAKKLRTKPGALLRVRKGHVEGADTHTWEWRNMHDTLQLFQCSKKKRKRKRDPLEQEVGR